MMKSSPFGLEEPQMKIIQKDVEGAQIIQRAIEQNSGGPKILPNESKEDSRPVT